MENDGRRVEEESEESGDTEGYESDSSHNICQD